VKQAREILLQLNTAATSMNGFLSPQNKKEVDQTLANIRQVTGDLKATQAKLDNLLGELNGVAAENRPALQATIADLAQITSHSRSASTRSRTTSSPRAATSTSSRARSARRRTAC
jgi:ABC-type transporter Mla subunit MlaD